MFALIAALAACHAVHSLSFLPLPFLRVRGAPFVTTFTGAPTVPIHRLVTAPNKGKEHTTPLVLLHLVPEEQQQSSLLPNESDMGLPSSPGWKKGRLDELTDWAVNDRANRPIICEYESNGLWLWTRWKGTVLSMIAVPVLLSMLVGFGVDVAAHSYSEYSWSVLAIPPTDDPLVVSLQGLNSLWEYQFTLCSLVLTFFTAEAYKHWRSVYSTTRAIQGRINDICLLVTIGSQRNNPASQELVVCCTRLLKTSHTFFWAATLTHSDGVGDRRNNDANTREVGKNAIEPLLLSPEGLMGLVRAGELTMEEADSLLNSGLPPSQYTYILMEWVGLSIMEGLDMGLLGRSGSNRQSGLEENLLRQLTALRGEYFNISYFTAGRMPLAYVQLMQILVDSLVLLAPFSLYGKLGGLSIPLTGLLTFFFKGLLELSKSFLDPFGNEGYPGHNIRVDVLVSELNFGAASRWVKAAEAYPKAPPNEKAAVLPKRDH